MQKKRGQHLRSHQTGTFEREEEETLALFRGNQAQMQEAFVGVAGESPGLQSDGKKAFVMCRNKREALWHGE